MSNFDQKNIPTLEDIIDDDQASDDQTSDNQTNDKSVEIPENEEIHDLLETDIENSATESLTETEVKNVDKENIQHTLNHSFQEIYAGLHLQLGNKTQTNDTNSDEDIITADSHITIEPEILEQVVTAVVKQMMPDLEQQLRFLIQQSLEEKLPEEIIKLSTNASSDS